jgi:hypothetical protein
MQRRSILSRWLLTATLMSALLFGALGQSLAGVEAAPQKKSEGTAQKEYFVDAASVQDPNAAPQEKSDQPEQKEDSVQPAPMPAPDSLNVVISEFRFLGPAGGSDEFVELFNPSNGSIDISGWKIMGANNSGSAGSTRYTIPASTSLAPGQHYLIVGSSYSGSVPGEPSAVLSSSITDDGGIALVDGTTVIDAVGLSSGTVYKEGTPLSPLSGTADQSYERKTAGNASNCNDTNNNAADFIWNSSSSNPQNTSSAPLACLTVVNVTSTTPDGTYTTNDPINVQIVFSSAVNVTGMPSLLLETGTTDRPATYSTGSGTNTLNFAYTVVAGDFSNKLGYVSANALSLNGGTITGAVGDATLILPMPGQPGSLSANNDIRINSLGDPSVLSFKRQNPLSTFTNADTLTFRATFSEPVVNVGLNDFIINGTTATFTVTQVSGSVYDVVVSTGNLAGLNNTVGLDLVGSPTINDSAGNPLPPGEPVIDETYTVDNLAPSVAIVQAVGQPDPASVRPILFTATFSEPINATTFTGSDVLQKGNNPFVTWTVAATANPAIFTLSAYPMGNGSILPTIAAGLVQDLAGNSNTQYDPAMPVDAAACVADPKCVQMNDITPPTVTVNQQPIAVQPDPAFAFPVKFDVVFSEAINVGTFTTSDITQNGTATGITWSIADSGDHMNFVISATSVTGFGTIIPTIAANRVTDLVGNGNTVLPSTDNSVTLTFSTTINQAVGQVDPAIVLPIRFTVLFSTPINVSTFTTSDITQNGTATGITWSIVDSGDHKTFTLSATNVFSYGTLKPFIPANSVNESASNTLNLVSSVSGGDDSVTYQAGPTLTPTFTPSPTRTPTQTYTPTLTPTPIGYKTVIITEVAWMGTAASSNDEWIELFNLTSQTIDMTGWQIRSFTTIYATPKIITFSSTTCNQNIPINDRCKIAPGAYFLLERLRDDVVSDIPADLIFPSSFQMSNGGEMLILCSPYNVSADNCKPTTNNLYDKVVDVVNTYENTGTATPTSSTLNPWPAGNTSYYGSMERKNLISNEDTNWFTHPDGGQPRNGLDANGKYINGTPKSSNWAFEVTATPRPTVTPTRTRTPVAQPAPILVLNEFLVRPGHDWNQDGVVNTYDEFIEVINAGTVSLNLSAYKLDDYEQDAAGNQIKNGFNLPSRVLQPGEIAVFFASQTGISLNDSGDTVRLVKASNYTIVDAYTYPPARSLDVSWCRYTDGYGSWVGRCFPTPGRPNSLTGDLFPPDPSGGASKVCLLPDSAPVEFLLAECEQGGLGIWNPMYWDSFPGEGLEFWLFDTWDKWLVIYQ